MTIRSGAACLLASAAIALACAPEPDTGPVIHSLTVTKTGLRADSAVITSTPAGIVCGSFCSAPFAEGTAVTLSTSVHGSVFAGWASNQLTCQGLPTCTVTIGTEVSTTATYRGALLGFAVGGTSCLRDSANAGDVMRTILGHRGHTVAFLTSVQLDSPAEIEVYDAILLGGQGTSCGETQAGPIDQGLDAYVRVHGGGLVGTGWLIAFEVPLATNMYAALPSVMVADGRLVGDQVLTPVAGSPITDGVTTLVAKQFVPYGGGAKPGAITLLTAASGEAVATSWAFGAGRAVFLGPMYLEDFRAWENESLLDGTQPSAIELLVRAVEWASKAR